MKTLTLHNGELRFSCKLYEADPSAPLVVCLHGFPDNADSFRFQIEDFVGAGFRVLVPTMRGYEPSSITKNTSYATNFLAEDVFRWLEELNVEAAHIVGHDWGAAVAYSAASKHPDKIISITTIAVPHPRRFSREGLQRVPIQNLKSWYMLFNQIPLVSEYFAQLNDYAFLRFLWRRWSPSQKLSTQERESLSKTYRQPGVIKAMLSYYRHNVNPLQIAGLKKNDLNSLREIPVPNLAISGDQDGCIDTRVFDHAILEEDHPEGFEMHRIDGAGHFVHQEQPKIVNPMIISWLHKQNLRLG